MTGILRGSLEPRELIDGLAATPRRLEEAAPGASDAQLDAAPAGEWSARTVLAHLRDDEFMIGRLRLERMLVEDNPQLAPFDEKAWAASRWRGRDALSELLDGFRLQREASLAILRRLHPEEWRRTGIQPEYGVFDIQWWVESWLAHDESHFAQLVAALEAAR